MTMDGELAQYKRAEQDTRICDWPHVKGEKINGSNVLIKAIKTTATSGRVNKLSL